ncbi:MAG: trypsin-like peptidase domain-containing protein [Planctomycetes bacterium]|nr:trypsin-like peptidase domain-containing protein [Planctomycetota bacterium]
MSSIRKLEEPEPAEAAYYEGYHRGHLDTAKMLSRRSLMYLVIGSFFGSVLMFLVFSSGALDRLTADEPVIEDPALTQEKPKEFVNAINWAKQFTVGIVAETPERLVPTRVGYGRIPGQTHVGSGVVLNSDGYILTNAHVIPTDATKLSVVLDDNMYEARFIGQRPEYDLAVIKIVAEELVPATLGDSGKVEQGDVVVAIGSPYGLFHTATEGIISFVGRRNDNASTLVRNYLQTSAAINPGNSGGPLIDLTGRVIGINTWKLNEQAEGTDGIGFAIPINIARKVFYVIIASDDTSRDETISSTPRSISTAYLGVAIDDGYRPEAAQGALVREVIYGTAAEDAGLKPGDLITRIDGTNIDGLDDLRTALKQFEPGARIKLTYTRNGEAHTIEVTLRD